eukprot:g5579.t1
MSVLELDGISVRHSTGISKQGKLTINSTQASWTGDDCKEVTVSKEDVKCLTWIPVHVGHELALAKVDGSVVHFTGLREEHFAKIKEFATLTSFGTVQKEQIAATGQNWGELRVDGKIVSFSQAEHKPIFKITLPDVSTVQHTKDEVTFEFAAGEMNSTAANCDTLVGMSFHIPVENEDFPDPQVQGSNSAEEDEQDESENKTSKETQKKELPAKKFYKMIFPHIDASGKSDLPIGTFREVTVMVPRGKFEVQLHHSYLKMLGQAHDFKIYYSSILKLFILPKPNPPTTTVVTALDPPIRKGQTFYNHVLFQFDSESKMSMELSISQSEIDALNVKNSGALTKELESWEFDIFAACLRGLSGAKIIRPRSFTNYANDGSCVRCSYKTDEGFLFPLEHAFFFIHKPPLCVSHEEIEIVEFQRQGTHTVSASTKTFDLCVRTKQGVEHQFRGIEKSEWQPLFSFIQRKNLAVENVDSVRQGPVQQAAVMRFEDMDLGNNNSDRGSDDSDPDFAMNPNEDQDGTSSQSDGSSGAEMVDEADISEPEAVQEEEQDDVMIIDEPDDASKATMSTLKRSYSATKKSKGPTEKEPTKKQKKKKKDKNAPKKNLSAYVFFSKYVRSSIKEENPDITFGEVGKVIGEKWKALPAEEKTKYQEMAEKDKIRYTEEKETYDKNKAEGKKDALDDS